VENLQTMRQRELAPRPIGSTNSNTPLAGMLEYNRYHYQRLAYTQHENLAGSPLSTFDRQSNACVHAKPFRTSNMHGCS
jgi:hypothetical protein